MATHALHHTTRTPTKTHQLYVARFLFAQGFCISCTVVLKEQRQVVLVACCASTCLEYVRDQHTRSQMYLNGEHHAHKGSCQQGNRQSVGPNQLELFKRISFVDLACTQQEQQRSLYVCSSLLDLTWS